jgi:hypothetical protein
VLLYGLLHSSHEQSEWQPFFALKQGRLDAYPCEFTQLCFIDLFDVRFEFFST